METTNKDKARKVNGLANLSAIMILNEYLSSECKSLIQNYQAQSLWCKLSLLDLSTKTDGMYDAVK